MNTEEKRLYQVGVMVNSNAAASMLHAVAKDPKLHIQQLNIKGNALG